MLQDRTCMLDGHDAGISKHSSGKVVDELTVDEDSLCDDLLSQFWPSSSPFALLRSLQRPGH
jgi:hypothetical protein